MSNKQIVTAKYPTAKAVQRPNGTWEVNTNIENLIADDARMLGAGSNPNKAWADAAREVQAEEERAALVAQYEAKQTPVTPPQRLVMVSRKVKQARRKANKDARASRKRNRAA